MAASAPKSAEAGAPEIEITPEMIEAGVNALWGTGAIEHPCEADRQIVEKVFNAMFRLSSSFAALRPAADQWSERAE